MPCTLEMGAQPPIWPAEGRKVRGGCPTLAVLGGHLPLEPLGDSCSVSGEVLLILLGLAWLLKGFSLKTASCFSRAKLEIREGPLA